MNDRIKQLEIQAHELAWQEWRQLPESNNGVKIDAKALERFKNKFAELIIEECARRAEAYAYTSPNFTALAEELRRMSGR